MHKNTIKILVTDLIHPFLAEKLRGEGFNVDTQIDISRDTLIKTVHEYSGLIVRSRLIIDSKIITAAKHLLFIARAGSGMESIDTETAAKKGITCINSPEGNRDAVGEHALGMLLALMHNINKADKEVKQGQWDRQNNRTTELKNKKIGIIGYGNTGSSFAGKLKGFEVEILAHDKYKTGFSDAYVKEAGLEDIFKECDIVSLHLPLTKETQYYVNKQFLNNFSKKIILLNTSRGPVVDTAALAEAMKSGIVKGAALDVIEYEETAFESLKLYKAPEPFNFLRDSEKVILSPHIAGVSHEAELRHAEVLSGKIINFFAESSKKI